MKVLLTGATGYIAQRLLPVLLQNGHSIVCCVRDKQRFNLKKYKTAAIEVVEVDFLNESSLVNIPADIDVAYYLIHSMSGADGDFEELEQASAKNFRLRIERTNCRQVIYLSGIANAPELSKHLSSRQNVAKILTEGSYAFTALKAGIIVGSGSASFEIIRDLVEKLPVMIAPKWLHTKTQPIAIRNVIEFLSGVMLNEQTYNNSYDIGGPDVLTYKEMLLRFAAIRGLKRKIIVVPVMTPRLSSYWLYFVTSTSYTLAKNLVDSMKVEVIVKDNSLADLLGINLISYDDAIKIAFDKIEQNEIVSSWKDALTSRILNKGLSKHIEVPKEGVFKDHRSVQVSDTQAVLNRIFSIGGGAGWYYANWLWGIRGFLDKIFGGPGIRRGRKNLTDISAGETLDFWRVIYADRTEKRLLLYAEMKLPGEAWLEFKLNKQNQLEQTATFRPLGLWGRLYWYAVLPFHGYLFKGMINKIAGTDNKKK